MSRKRFTVTEAICDSCNRVFSSYGGAMGLAHIWHFKCGHDICRFCFMDARIKEVAYCLKCVTTKKKNK